MRIAAGRLKGRTLPSARGARPVPGRLRTSLFSVLERHLAGARVLDGYAGVGALGLEALSRGAQSVLLLDKDPLAVRALEAWIQEVGVSRQAEARRHDLSRGPLPPGPYDLVFLDPPFSFWERGDAADLLARAAAVLDASGLLVLKMPARQALPEGAPLHLLKRRTIGSVAWVLLRSEAPAAPDGALADANA